MDPNKRNFDSARFNLLWSSFNWLVETAYNVCQIKTFITRVAFKSQSTVNLEICICNLHSWYKFALTSVTRKLHSFSQTELIFSCMFVLPRLRGSHSNRGVFKQATLDTILLSVYVVSNWLDLIGVITNWETKYFEQESMQRRFDLVKY